MEGGSPSGWHISPNAPSTQVTTRGGVNDDVSLSAYITSALLELGRSPEDPVVAQGLRCLRGSLPSVTSVYTMALLFYTFTLAGDEGTRQELASKLEEAAIKSAGQMHWTYTPREDSTSYYWSQPESVDVETTAYVLLGYLCAADVSQINVNNAVEIVSWLVKQQTANGGFASTQDTVVALQALAKYAALTYGHHGKVTVTVTGTHGFFRQLLVNDENHLLLQQEPLTEIPGEYMVSTAGDGCVYVQTMLGYNIPTPVQESPFQLRVDAESFAIEGCTLLDMYIVIQVSYHGPRGVTNMVIIEVQMISGFKPQDSVAQVLAGQVFVRRTEASSDMVIIYLEQLDNVTQTYSFGASREVQVEQVHPAGVKIYDYYHTGEYAEQDYLPTLIATCPDKTTPLVTTTEGTPFPDTTPPLVTTTESTTFPDTTTSLVTTTESTPFPDTTTPSATSTESTPFPDPDTTTPLVTTTESTPFPDTTTPSAISSESTPFPDTTPPLVTTTEGTPFPDTTTPLATSSESTPFPDTTPPLVTTTESTPFPDTTPPLLSTTADTPFPETTIPLATSTESTPLPATPTILMTPGPMFHLSVESSFSAIAGSALVDLNIIIHVSYGPPGVSNNAVIQVMMLSGFHPPENLDGLIGYNVAGVVRKADYLSISLLQLDSVTQTFSFTASGELHMGQLQPGKVFLFNSLTDENIAQDYLPVMPTTTMQVTTTTEQFFTTTTTTP